VNILLLISEIENDNSFNIYTRGHLNNRPQNPSKVHFTDLTFYALKACKRSEACVKLFTEISNMANLVNSRENFSDSIANSCLLIICLSICLFVFIYLFISRTPRAEAKRHTGWRIGSSPLQDVRVRRGADFGSDHHLVNANNAE